MKEEGARGRREGGGVGERRNREGVRKNKGRQGNHKGRQVVYETKQMNCKESW
jgi:hypothetical protein